MSGFIYRAQTALSELPTPPSHMELQRWAAGGHFEERVPPPSHMDLEENLEEKVPLAGLPWSRERGLGAPLGLPQPGVKKKNK